MALITEALTTVARVKSYLGISAATWDTVLELLVNAVSQQIVTYCDRDFVKTAVSNEVYDGHGTNELLLKLFPVDTTETITLQERDSNDNNANWTTVNAQNYFVKANGIVVLPNTVFLDLPQHYRISYTAGYNFDNAVTFLSDAGAADLELACWKLIATAFNDRKNSTKIKSESLGDYSVTFARDVDLDTEIKQILDNYKRPYGVT